MLTLGNFGLPCNRSPNEVYLAEDHYEELVLLGYKIILTDGLYRSALRSNCNGYIF